MESIPVEDRMNLRDKFRLRHPDHIPLILNINRTEKKLLVNKDSLMYTINNNIRKNILMTEHETGMLLVRPNNILLKGTDSLQDVYEKFKQADGFLYLDYKTENTFG